MRALAATYFLAAALAMPALLWAADDPPAGPATTTAPATTPAPPADSAAQSTPAPAPAAPAAPPAADTTPAPPPPPAPAQPATTTSPAPTTTVPAEIGTAPRSAPQARAAGSTVVTIKNFAFAPQTTTVNVGDSVSWTNQDSAAHTATAKDGSFDTGNLNKGKIGSHKFTKAGSFAYICSIHPNMKGTVVVKAASTGAGSGGGGSSSGSSGSSSSGSDSSSSGSSGSTAASKTSSLPSTGGEITLTALLGLLLLGGGALMRRRVGD